MPNATLDLTGRWQFKEFPSDARRMRDIETGGWLETTVPSSIYTSLAGAGLIDPTELNTHPERFAYISEKAWVYRKTFDLPEDFTALGRIDLVFDGLDTITHVWLNEKLIARTDNMFNTYRFDVTDSLKPADNHLLVKFSPALAHAERLAARYGDLPTAIGFQHRSFIRKAQYQLGWDFCPSLPGCGIYRPVRMEAVSCARIENTNVRTIECDPNFADIMVAIQIDNTCAGSDQSSTPLPLTCELIISAAGTPDITQTFTFVPHNKRQSTVIRIDNPNLWWPNGHGPQHLYKLDVKLKAADLTIDHVAKNFGIRTVRLNRSNDSHGQSFKFELNHRPIYIKGANWVPLSMFPGTAADTDYETILTRAAEANMNTLRVWGGGYYEDDHFYDLCDRLGIMVWQDFMFASAYYPDRSWFLDAVKTEAALVIKRLRSHPSIILWCGNSEIDHLHLTGRLGSGRKFYGKPIYHDLLPQLLAELDPDRDYIPSTPIGPKSNLNTPISGTVHRWDVWTGYEPTRKYACPTEKVPRFVTEFGIQSLPSIDTIKTFCGNSELHPGSQTLEKHNYQLDGPGRLARYLAEFFRPPKNLDDLAYLTQLIQARAYKTHIEYLRAHNHISAGVLFWQLNDCFGAVTCSAIDYTQTPKALYYYGRRFFAPVLATLTEARQNDALDPTRLIRSPSVVVINDQPDPIAATLSCRLTDLSGSEIDQAVFSLALAPFTNSPSLKLPKAISQPPDPARAVLTLTLESDVGPIAQNTFFYLPDKYIDHPAARITKQITTIGPKQWKLALKSDAFVKDLQIIPPERAVLSDNFFDMLSGKDYEVTIDFDTPPTSSQNTVKLRSAKSTL